MHIQSLGYRKGSANAKRKKENLVVKLGHDGDMLITCWIFGSVDGVLVWTFYVCVRYAEDAPRPLWRLRIQNIILTICPILEFLQMSSLLMSSPDEVFDSATVILICHSRLQAFAFFDTHSEIGPHVLQRLSCPSRPQVHQKNTYYPRVKQLSQKAINVYFSP
jgi:hypothetical protein